MHEPISDSIRALILALEQPAFLIRDGVILLSNERAPSAEEALRSFLNRIPCPETASVTEGAWIFTMSPLGDLTLVQAKQAVPAPLPAAAAQALRQPLSDLFAATHNLNPIFEDLEDEELFRSVSLMNRSMYRLLRSVLTIDTLRTEALPLRKEVMDLAEFLRTLCREAEYFCRAAGVGLCAELSERRIRILADRQFLERSILNLLSNAIRSTPVGSDITIRLFVRGDQAVMEVHSTTSSPVSLSDFFSRGEDGPAEPDQGAGLGLPLVRRFAELHDGVFLLRPAEDSVSALLALPISRDSGAELRCPTLSVDYAGGHHHILVELSDVLPIEVYSPLDIS